METAPHMRRRGTGRPRRQGPQRRRPRRWPRRRQGRRGPGHGHLQDPAPRQGQALRARYRVQLQPQVRAAELCPACPTCPHLPQDILSISNSALITWMHTNQPNIERCSARAQRRCSACMTTFKRLPFSRACKHSAEPLCMCVESCPVFSTGSASSTAWRCPTS